MQYLTCRELERRPKGLGQFPDWQVFHEKANKPGRRKTMNGYFTAEHYDKERGEWIIKRPRVSGIRLNSRDQVKLWRACAAYDLACINGTPYESRVEECAYLLDRITRYSLALERQAENDNDADIYRVAWKRKRHEHNAELLEKRGDRLEKELQEFAPGCKIRRGVYANIEDPETHNDIVHLYYY